MMVLEKLAQIYKIINCLWKREWHSKKNYDLYYSGYYNDHNITKSYQSNKTHQMI